MENPTPAVDRRREARMLAAGLINWHRGDRSHWGLLNDNTHESVAFVTPCDWTPEIGERVDVECSGQPCRSYRVARVASYERTLALVACTSDWLD